MSAPAAAAPATSTRPRIGTAAAAPTLGPTGSWPSETTAMSTAIESNSDACTPTSCSSSQLRRICAATATRTKATTRDAPRRLRSTESPTHSSRPLRTARWRRPALVAAMAVSATSGPHHGRPSGPTSVNDVSAPSPASTARIGSSAASSVGTRGHVSGDERRSAVMRAAMPSWPLSRPPRTAMLDARYSAPRRTVPPAAPIERCQASLRASSAPTCSTTAIASAQPAGLDSAAANAWRWPESARARSTKAASDPPATTARRRGAISVLALGRAVLRVEAATGRDRRALGVGARARVRGRAAAVGARRVVALVATGLQAPPAHAGDLAQQPPRSCVLHGRPPGPSVGVAGEEGRTATTHDRARPTLLLPRHHATLNPQAGNRCPAQAVFSARSRRLTDVPASAVHTRRRRADMATGIVKWFNDDKGFGFVTPDEGGKDLFVHHTGISGDGFKSLAEGAKVSYDAEAGDKGPKAVNVTPI